MNEEFFLRQCEHLVNMREKFELIYKDFPLTLSYKLTIKMIAAKVCIYGGLLNNDKSLYDYGIANFLQYSTESIDLADNRDVISLHNPNKINVYKNSEGKRQISLKLKTQYDEFISWGKQRF
jgi:hypothetical protein